MTKKRWSLLKMRGVALGRRHRPGVVENLPEFVDGVADVRTQQVLAEELVEHLADGRFQERDTAGVAGAVPGIRTIGGVMRERPEEGRHQRIQIRPCLAQDVAREEFRRVFQHVDEAVEFTQDVVRDVARCARFAVQEDGDFGIAETHFFHKAPQLFQGGVGILGRARQFLVVNRQHKGRGTRLLLCEGCEVTVVGHPQHFHAFFFNRLG